MDWILFSLPFMVGVPSQLAVVFDDAVASVAAQLAVVQSWITPAPASGGDGGLDHRDHMASSPTADPKNSWVTEESENEWRRWDWRRKSGGFSSAQTPAISAPSEEPSFAGEVTTGSPEPLPSAGSVRVSNARNHRRGRHSNLTAEKTRR